MDYDLTDRKEILDAVMSELGFDERRTTPSYYGPIREYIYIKPARGGHANNLGFKITDWRLKIMTEDEFVYMIRKLREDVHGQN